MKKVLGRFELIDAEQAHEKLNNFDLEDYQESQGFIYDGTFWSLADFEVSSTYAGVQTLTNTSAFTINFSKDREFVNLYLLY